MHFPVSCQYGAILVRRLYFKIFITYLVYVNMSKFGTCTKNNVLAFLDRSFISLVKDLFEFGASGPRELATEKSKRFCTNVLV